MLALKQSTSINIKLGPFLDKTDGVTEEIALTPVVEVSKNGGAFAARSGTTVTADGTTGYYLIQLNTTDTGTLGRLRVKSHDNTTHLPVWQDYMIMPANVWDSLFGADVLQVDLTQMGGVPQSATDLKHFADSGYDPATGKVVEVATLTGHTVQTADHTAGIADIPTVAEFNARTLLAASYFDSTADTVTVGTNNDKTGYSLSQTFPANFSSLIITGSGAIDSMLQGYLDTVITETSLGRIAGNVKVFWDNTDALTTKVVDDVGVAGSSLTQQQVRDAMKLAPTVGAPSAGSVDEHLDDILTDTDDLQLNQGNWTTAVGFALATVCTEARLSELDAAITGKMANDTSLILADTNELQLNQVNWLTAVNFSTHTAADVWAAVTRELTSGNNIALAKGLGLTGLNDIVATAIVSGGAINTTGGAVDTITTYTGNTKQTGDSYALGNGASGFVAIKAETALIVADTNELQLDWVNTGRLDTILDSILSLLDDPRAEPGQGALVVNPDSMTKIDYIYKFLRNKVETTATEVKVYDDAGTTVDHKKTISDDGTTFTDGEIVTGP